MSATDRDMTQTAVTCAHMRCEVTKRTNPPQTHRQAGRDWWEQLVRLIIKRKSLKARRPFDTNSEDSATHTHTA